MKERFLVWSGVKGRMGLCDLRWCYIPVPTQLLDIAVASHANSRCNLQASTSPPTYRLVARFFCLLLARLIVVVVVCQPKKKTELENSKVQSLQMALRGMHVFQEPDASPDRLPRLTFAIPKHKESWEDWRPRLGAMEVWYGPHADTRFHVH